MQVNWPIRNMYLSLQALCCRDWFWNSNLPNAGHHHLLRHAGDAEPSLSWCSSHGRHFPLRVYGTCCWLLLGQTLQDHQRKRMEGTWRIGNVNSLWPPMSVGRSGGFLKGLKVTRSCSYRSTCFALTISVSVTYNEQNKLCEFFYFYILLPLKSPIKSKSREIIVSILKR